MTPGLPFDPRLVGPIDLAIAGVRRAHSWARDNSTALIAGTVAIILIQIALYAQSGFVFLTIPQIPNWILIMIGTVILFAPLAATTGVLLGRGLYQDETVMLSVTRADDGSQQIKHVAPDRFDNLTIVNQNGEVRSKSFLETVPINGRQAFEVDSFDADNDVVVASSMAGRTNQDVRADRIAIRNIKTDMEREVDEAVEMKANARDIIRERSGAVANWLIRTAQGATVPDGASLFDEMQDSLENVDPLADMDSSPAADSDDPLDDPDDDDLDRNVEDETEERGASVNVDIFDRAEGAAADD